MKLALITHHFPPHFNAGAEQYAYRIARELYHRGHHIEVVCIESVDAGGLHPFAFDDALRGVPVRRLHLNLELAPNSFERSFRNPELGKWVSEYLQASSPDIVHVNSGYLLGGSVLEAVHAAGLPLVLTLHDYWFLCPRHTLQRTDGSVCPEPVPAARCVWCKISEKRRYRLPDQRLGGRLGDLFVALSRPASAIDGMGLAASLELVEERRDYLRRVLDYVDVAIAPSRFLIQKFEQYGLIPRRMIYLPFGLERLPSSQPVGSRQRPLNLGYLGQLAPHKGVHLLIDAFRRVDPSSAAMQLWLYGKEPEGDPYVKELRRLAGGDPAIHFAGPYANDRVYQLLQELDAIVVPSLWYENRPTVIVEAQASKTAVIAARIGGIPELVTENVDGLLFAPGDVPSLVAQLQRVRDEPELLARLGASAPPVPSVSDEVDKLEAVYTGLLINARIPA